MGLSRYLSTRVSLCYQMPTDPLTDSQRFSVYTCETTALNIVCPLRFHPYFVNIDTRCGESFVVAILGMTLALRSGQPGHLLTLNRSGCPRAGRATSLRSSYSTRARPRDTDRCLKHPEPLSCAPASQKGQQVTRPLSLSDATTAVFLQEYDKSAETLVCRIGIDAMSNFSTSRLYHFTMLPLFC